MTDLTIRCSIADLNEELPAEGYHPALVASARLRTSQNGNPMLQVIYNLPQASPGCDTVPEYFVLWGCTPRACGFHPLDGEVLRPADLVGSQLEIRLGHESYDGTLRLRVLGYRATP